MTTYCLDSNILINQWQNYYSPELVPSYWELLDSFASKGKIFIPQEVYEELDQGEDDLSKWVKERSGILVKGLNDQIQDSLLELMNLEPIQNLIDSKKKLNAADPFVLAYSKALNATAVSDDRKLVNISKQLSIPCISGPRFIKENNISFQITSDQRVPSFV